MTSLQVLTTQVVEVDENKNVVTRKVESSSLFRTVCDSFFHGAMRLFQKARSVGTKFMERVLDW